MEIAVVLAALRRLGEALGGGGEAVLLEKR